MICPWLIQTLLFLILIAPWKHIWRLAAEPHVKQAGLNRLFSEIVPLGEFGDCFSLQKTLFKVLFIVLNALLATGQIVFRVIDQLKTLKPVCDASLRPQ